MPTRTNRQVLLNAHPVGFPVDTDFKMVETSVPEPGDGELLIRTIYQSLDPYMRGRMNQGRSYAAGVSLGEVMGAGTVGQVVASRHDRFAEGDFLRGVGGWIRSGELRHREDIVDGIENAVGAFQGLLRGENFGKLLVRVNDDPTQ